jgi:hypothetical protein
MYNIPSYPYYANILSINLRHVNPDFEAFINDCFPGYRHAPGGLGQSCVYHDI